ncbi:hypothetical protein ACFQ60_02955 [Streptomyces zhihengii]
MAETSDEAQLIADGFGRVLVELEWYDGLRVGLVDINGQPHYFDGYGQYLGDEADEYRVWPASPAAVELEREQWAIYVDWNERQGLGLPIWARPGSTHATTNWTRSWRSTVRRRPMRVGLPVSFGIPALVTEWKGPATGSDGVRAGEAAVDH